MPVAFSDSDAASPPSRLVAAAVGASRGKSGGAALAPNTPLVRGFAPVETSERALQRNGGPSPLAVRRRVAFGEVELISIEANRNRHGRGGVASPRGAGPAGPVPVSLPPLETHREPREGLPYESVLCNDARSRRPTPAGSHAVRMRGVQLGLPNEWERVICLVGSVRDFRPSGRRHPIRSTRSRSGRTRGAGADVSKCQ